MAWTRTFGQMKTDLGTWLGVDTDADNPNYVRLSGDVREFLILQARRRIYLRRDLRFFEATDEIVTADGSYTNGLPTDWGRPYYMWYNDPSTNKDVEIANIVRSKWRTLYNADATSNDKPEKYNIYGSNYNWIPTPNAAHTLYCDYYAMPADLSDDGDYDEFLTKGWDAIFFEACAKGCAYVMELSRLDEFKELAKGHLSALGGDDARARYSGRGLQNEIPG
jgi:hypothetical protein